MADNKPSQNVGKAPMMGPGHGPRGVQKPKNFKKTLLRLFGYFAPYKLQLVIIIITTMTSSLAGVAGTYFLKPIINELTKYVGQRSPDLSALVSTLMLMGVIYAFGLISTYVYNRLMLNVSTGTMRNIRVDMFKHMQDLPIKHYDTHSHGELMSLYTNDTDTLREALGRGIPHLITSLFTVAGVFIMMLILSPVLTILVILMVFVMLISIKKIGGKSAQFFSKQQRDLGKVNGFIEEMISGQKVIKVFCHESKIKEEFDEINEELRSSACSAQTFASILMPIMGNLSYINYAMTATLGAWLVLLGYSDIGTIASFLQYTRSFSHPISMISQQFNTLFSALAGAERIFAMLDLEKEDDAGFVTLVNIDIAADGTLTESKKKTGLWAWKGPGEDGKPIYTQVKGDVRFNNVVFGYEPGKTVINNITLYAKPGQKIALVGSTGAGKTTITNLINRFYDINEGEILYDGIPVKNIKKEDLRRSLAMVLQDTHLFTGTVMDNIRYGKLDASDEDVLRAAKIANADFFISHLPQGYHTMISGDGSNLSQGQRQLIAIARAAIAEPPVLILDEATSSIDTRTEAHIESGMDKLMEGRTVFVIAHRLSTVRNSNAIMVMENGEIIERGDHDSLLSQRGKYYQLYTGMFELD
jgi:ATP-binding cassette subfamily B protein